MLSDGRSKTVWWVKQVRIWNINFIKENVWKWSTSDLTPLANVDGYFGGMKLWNSSVGNDFYPLPELHFAGLEYTDLLSWLFPANQLALDRILQNFEWQLILMYWKVRILSVFKMPMSIKNFLLTSLRLPYGDTSKRCSFVVKYGESIHLRLSLNNKCLTESLVRKELRLSSLVVRKACC